jgi:arginyl-tRNA synthetase
MSFEGNSGPYIQYAYVRARRILEKEHYVPIADFSSLEIAAFSSSQEIDLAKNIMNFQNVLIESIENNYPHIITNYAYTLTKSFSSFYNSVRVKDEEDSATKQLKLFLVDSFSQTLKEVFGVL